MSTYWVSPSGNDSNNGTQAQPWQTLQTASRLLPGDTMDIDAGTYAGFVTGYDDPGGTYGTIAGTAGNPITIQADPNAAPGSVVINSRDNKTRWGIDLEPGSDYVTLSGITINDTGGITDASDRGGGIKVCGTGDIITGCTVQNLIYGFGLFSDFANGVQMINNTVHNVGATGDQDYGHGIYVSGTSSDPIVRGNIVYNCEFTGIQFNGDPANITNALIEDNIVHDNGQNGFNLDSLQNSIIRNNLVYNEDLGATLFTSHAYYSTGNVIVNNTFYHTASSKGGGGALKIEGGSTNTTILNNILFGGGGVALDSSSDSTSGTVSNYNIGESANTFILSADDGNAQTLASWRSATGQDNNSSISTASQLFVNASANDYHLSSTSPAIGAGTSTDAPATDLDGNPRPSGAGYDIGAYEYQSGTVTPTVISETPAPNATNVSVATTVTGTFNESVVGSSITTSNYRLKDNNNTVTATVSYTDSNHTATLTPSSALAYNTTYTATLSGAKDSAGDPMTSAVSWSFTTAAAVAPTVTSETPASGATSVAMSMVPTATFNEAVQANTISFTLMSSSGSSMAGSVSCNSTNNVATFTPTSALAPNTTYKATVSGAESMSGVSMTAPFSWSFTTTANQVALLNFSGGFASATSKLTLNGSTRIKGTKLELTNGRTGQAASAFSTSPVDVTRFSTQFTFQISPGSNTADGFTFTIQNNTPTAIGLSGGGLGYGPDDTGGTGGIPKSVAIKFDLYNNQGEGANSTGLYTDGVAPTNVGSIDLTSSGVNLHSGDQFLVNMTYDGTTLAVTIKDTKTGKSATQNYTINIPGTVGNSTAYVGFTGGTGGLTATQDILAWTFSPSAAASATPANESVSLVNAAQIPNQPSSQTLQLGPIQEAVNNGGTVLAPAADGDTSAPSAALQSSAESDVQDAAVASLVSGSPIGIVPESLVNALAQDRLQSKLVALEVGDQGGLGA